MSRQDETARKATTVIVAAVALFAAGDSYVQHLRPGAAAPAECGVRRPAAPRGRRGGRRSLGSHARRRPERQACTPARPPDPASGIAATAWANVAYGLPQGATGALLRVWPVAAYIACLELLTWMREHLGTKAASALAGRTAPAPGISEATAPGISRDELSDRRRDRQSLDEILRAAEAIFPGKVLFGVSGR